jgi:hypothetical protein
MGERLGHELSLAHQPFVDYYYATGDWCKLYLFLGSADTVLGTLGVEQMRFEAGSRALTLSIGSNYHSVQPGAGGFLFMQWLKSNPIGVVIGGSTDTHRIVSRLGWSYFRGVKTLVIKAAYTPYDGEARWRHVAKRMLRHWPRPGIRKCASMFRAEVKAGVSVQEEHEYDKSLLPQSSPFAFRFAPSLEYLMWRYNMDLSFVRYRLYRILDRRSTAGYVIISDSPDRVAVAQCDAGDPVILASGVLLSILEVTRNDEKAREVLLASSHLGMVRTYSRAGFHVSKADRPFVLGSLQQKIDLSRDTSNWLVNVGWGDNDLVPPFLDQLSVAT